MNHDVVEPSEAVSVAPLISVIVAVYNGAETLQRCIDSVVNQTYPHVELIVMDGASTDGSVDILKAKDLVIACWESEQDRGIYHAWNKALRHVNGDWICFLGADDYFWSSDALEKMVGHLKHAEPPYRVVYGQVALVNKKDEILCYVGESWKDVKEKFRHVMALPHQGIMHHISLFETHGVFDEGYMIAGDYELLLRELQYHDALFVSEVIMVGMRQGGVSSDPSRSLLLLIEIRRAQKKLMERVSGWQWWVAYIKVRLRLLLWRMLGELLARKVLDAARLSVGKSRYWTRM